MASIWSFMWAMFSRVHFSGGTLFFSAAFSAGRPKASQPIGISTFLPFMRSWRVSMSLMV
jgi:hypothetical protein